jgi:hypothetical protein
MIRPSAVPEGKCQEAPLAAEGHQQVTPDNPLTNNGGTVSTTGIITGEAEAEARREARKITEARQMYKAAVTPQKDNRDPRQWINEWGQAMALAKDCNLPEVEFACFWFKDFLIAVLRYITTGVIWHPCS